MDTIHWLARVDIRGILIVALLRDQRKNFWLCLQKHYLVPLLLDDLIFGRDLHIQPGYLFCRLRIIRYRIDNNRWQNNAVPEDDNGCPLGCPFKRAICNPCILIISSLVAASLFNGDLLVFLGQDIIVTADLLVQLA